MRNMKDSGIEWIGEIPEDWEVVKLKNIAKIQTGNTPSKNSDENYYSTEGTMWVKPDNLNDLNPIQCTKEYLNNNGKKLARVVPPKTPLVCCIGSIGKVGYSNKEVAFNQQINSVEFNNNCYWKFGLYSLISNEYQHWLYSNGNVIKILNNEGHRKLTLSLPPLEEQELIADYLDNKVKEIDNIILKTQETIEQYKKYKQSVITEAVTKGLNPNVEMKDSGIEWIGKIPKYWNIKKMKFISDIIMGQSPDSETIKDNGEILFMQGNVDFNEIYPTPKTYCDNPKKKSRVNDILMSVRAPVGALNISDREYGIGRGLCSIMPLDINLKYLWYFLKKSVNDFNYYSNGSTFDAITVNTLNNFYITIPNRNEQVIISDFLDKKCKEIDNLISKKQELINQLESYKKSLIYEYVTGKKEVAVSYGY